MLVWPLRRTRLTAVFLGVAMTWGPALVASDDPAVEEVALEIGLGRRQVMSREGRLDAAQRWHDGAHGPDVAAAAALHCGTCGYPRIARRSGAMSRGHERRVRRSRSHRHATTPVASRGRPAAQKSGAAVCHAAAPAEGVDGYSEEHDAPVTMYRMDESRLSSALSCTTYRSASWLSWRSGGAIGRWLRG